MPVPRGSVNLDTADSRVAHVAGLDVIAQGRTRSSPGCGRSAGPFTLGNYAYADGGLHVRVSMAIDALRCSACSQQPRPLTGLLATPRMCSRCRGRSGYGQDRWNQRRTRRILQAPSTWPTCSSLPIATRSSTTPVVRWGSRTAWFRNRVPTTRWPSARSAGGRLWPATPEPGSLNVAPATRTRSVVKNRALAAAYAGAGQFGVEVFAP